MENTATEDFFRSVATRYVPISHTEAQPRFCRFDLEELTAQLRQDIDTSQFCLLMETPTGKLLDNGGDGFFDDQALAFWVIRQVPQNDFAQERLTLSLARQHGRNIVLKCRAEMPGLEPLSLSSVEYDKVGPIFNNCYGYRYSFVQPDQLDPRLDPADWNG